MSESQAIPGETPRPSARPESPAFGLDVFARLASGGRAAEQAAGEIYAEYAPRFRAFLRMRGISAQQAEDLVHDVFVRLIEAAPRLKDVNAPNAYLWGSLNHALTDRYRQAGRDRKRFAEPPAGTTTEGDEDPDFESWLERVLVSDGGEIERTDHFECVGRALERYRREEPEKAAAIDLVSIEGFEGRELAETLGRSYGAAREFLRQARKGFRALVQAMCGSLYG